MSWFISLKKKRKIVLTQFYNFVHNGIYSNENAYFIFGLFLYESGYLLTSYQFEKASTMHDVCLQTKSSENLYSVMRVSRMNAYGVKSKSHLFI